MLQWTVHLDRRGSWLGRSPGEENNHSAVAVGDKVYSFGGDDRGSICVHVFDPVTLRWTKLPPQTTAPSSRFGHRAVLIGHLSYIWGGYPHCNVLHAFDVNTHGWSKPQVSGAVPEGRHDHSACTLGEVMYVFGGANNLTGCTNAFHKLDTATMVWSFNSRGTPPPVLRGHSATIIGTKMFVFGGWGYRGEHYNNFRVFDTETYCWLSTPSTQPRPEVRASHTAFTYDGELYISGGGNWEQTFNDLWTFNPETFSWKKVEPKGEGPSRIRMCSCVVGDRAIFFRGDNAPEDLYILDLSPSLNTLCKQAVIQYGLERSKLPHHISCEMAAMTRRGGLLEWLPFGRAVTQLCSVFFWLSAFRK